MARRGYDLAIVGGGAAGLTLALALGHTDRRVVVLERSWAAVAARRWAFWSEAVPPFASAIERSWSTLSVHDGRATPFALDRFRYHMLTGAALLELVKGLPSIELRAAEVMGIEAGADRAEVVASDDSYQASFVLDSRPGQLTFTTPAGAPRLVQSFAGATLECATPRFDPERPTLFDFRLARDGKFRFGYVLPLSAHRAHCDVVATDEGPVDLSAELAAYGLLLTGGEPVSVVARERGHTELCGGDIERRVGERVLRIGIPGGRIQPSSGYGFMRCHRDAVAIVRSLDAHGHPFALPRARRRDRFVERVFLEAMVAAPEAMPTVFCRMFGRNPADRVLALLDERASLYELVRVAASLPKRLFLRAAIRHFRRAWR